MESFNLQRKTYWRQFVAPTAMTNTKLTLLIFRHPQQQQKLLHLLVLMVQLVEPRYLQALPNLVRFRMAALSIVLVVVFVV